jgi:hypothetical protein
MHLTFYNIKIYSYGGDYRFELDKTVDAGELLNTVFFYSVPTSFFILDERIPRVLRELLIEAEGCLKSNLLTGASVCARKMIYELGILSGAEGDNYEDRIKSLKRIHTNIDPAFFDTLLTVQQVTSSKVHERSYGSYDGWQAGHLKVILSSLAEVLNEIYVVPALRADRRRAVLELKDKLIPKEQPIEPVG